MTTDRDDRPEAAQAELAHEALISPLSEMTVAEWVENTIKDGTLDGLRAAVEVDPTNARLIAHFGLVLANLAVAEKIDPDDARRARAQADYQTHRALKLASENDEVKKLRTEVVKLLNLPSDPKMSLCALFGILQMFRYFDRRQTWIQIGGKETRRAAR